jgi:hypothetical protein
MNLKLCPKDPVMYYIAPNEEAVREHAKLGGFPANQIAVIGRMIDPTTAEM